MPSKKPNNLKFKKLQINIPLDNNNQTQQKFFTPSNLSLRSTNLKGHTQTNFNTP